MNHNGHRMDQGQPTITTSFRINIALALVIVGVGNSHSKLDHTCTVLNTTWTAKSFNLKKLLIT
jgi:hypothetical protein